MGVVVGEWRRGPVIGRGASATVSIATDALTGEAFAVKSVGIALAGALRREQSVLSALSSPYVVSCVGSSGASDDGRSYELFLELAPGGSLADEMKRCGGRCEEALVASRAGDVLRGLAHVHGAGIAHCDVKARNVLLGADGRAKLADFGCARWTTKAKEDGIGNAIMGTPMFMSPEAARGEAQGAAADIWALGCTVIEMATGGAPWRFSSPVAALHHVAHSGDVPEAPSWFSEQGKDFLARCLVRDPAQRWTAEQLLEHPFVAAVTSSSKAAPIAHWVSPKSVLDQDIWEDSSSTDSGDDTTVVPPADRVRALASVECSPDCWTWSGEEWITVCGGLTDTDSNTALSLTPEADTMEAAGSSNGDDEQVPSAAGDAGVDAPRGQGSSHGSSSSASAEDGAGVTVTLALAVGRHAVREAQPPPGTGYADMPLHRCGAADLLSSFARAAAPRIRTAPPP
ncbi:hypothetical protein BRADI_3g10887v3 [Brachypodium distachyon]|uniref:Protein kinase domain-containing protein n=1 Tax=Brachypodium distachyon TaxID=15368 RepID=A0A2K2CWI7_BRADI|nr:hypothetical protein BRADI_3g10887v3 [Brachypodium distachyon]